ncbi:acid protease [Rhizopogon vesiculosus]|uniref:Acid protease n=1 Tax=Rhizopogon vesiculosus TaxID=180088 RepID=A0A1J8Q8S3_9AGAM|nr:acid protease [Rhizopogon vesiculosus]
MLPFALLLTTLLLTMSIAASPVEVRDSPVTLPMARKLNLQGGTINLLQHDQARATALKDRTASGLDRRAGSAPITNEAVSYIVQADYLIVDTGSSNFWVGADTAYVKTSTSYDTGEPVEVDYGSGSFYGTEYTDTVTVTLGNGLTVTDQSIGVAAASTGFTGVDGIIGLGPVDLTEGTLTDEPSTTILTFTDNLYIQGVISEIVVSISFEPTTSEEVTNGELTFGGTDATKSIQSDSNYFSPLTATSPSSYYWGINESITYGTTTILSETAGIVDSGTTLILLASSTYLECSERF